MPSVLPRILASKARQAIEAFDLAAELSHSGESGRAREEAIRLFLAEIIPPDFDIDTGFVIDAKGGVSRQVDIVIYRRQRAPVLEVGGIKHFMVECVAAVVEVKAAVTSKKTLTTALDNIASVKGLDRTNDGRNVIANSTVSLNPNDFRHQIWSGVATGKSMTYLRVLGDFIEWIESNPRKQWPNAYVDIHKFMIDYAQRIDVVATERGSNPVSAKGVVGSAPWKHPWGLEPTLAFFGVELLNFLRVAPLVDFHPYGYFHSTALPMEKWHEFRDNVDSTQHG